VNLADKRGAEISEAVGNIISNQSSTVPEVLRLSAPPSIAPRREGAIQGFAGGGAAPFGSHSRASFCASVICAGVILSAS